MLNDPLVALQEKRLRAARDAFQQVVDEEPYFRRGKAKRKLKRVQQELELTEQYDSLLGAWDSKDLNTVVSIADEILAEISWHCRILRRRYRDVYTKRKRAIRERTRGTRKKGLRLPLFPIQIGVGTITTVVTICVLWKADSTFLDWLTEKSIPLLLVLASFVGAYYIYYNAQEEENKNKVRDLRRRWGWLIIVPTGLLIGILFLDCRNTFSRAGPLC